MNRMNYIPEAREHFFPYAEIELAEPAEDGSPRVRVTVNSKNVDLRGNKILNWDLSRFSKRPVMLAEHDHHITAQIGEWEDMVAGDKTLTGTAIYYTRPLEEGDPVLPHHVLAQVAYDLARRKAAAFSISFMPTGKVVYRHQEAFRKLPPEILKQNPRAVIEKARISEISHVTMPGNPDAIQRSLRDRMHDPDGRLGRAIDKFRRARNAGRN